MAYIFVHTLITILFHLCLFRIYEICLNARARVCVYVLVVANQYGYYLFLPVCLV